MSGNEESLEMQLRALGAELATHPTPDLTEQVRRRIASTEGARGPVAGRKRRIVITLAVAAAVTGGTSVAAAASPDLRSRIASIVHFHGVDITRSAARKVPAARDLGLGPSVPLARAQQLAAFPIRRPSALGQPASVLLLQRRTPGAIVTLVYPPGPALVRSPITGTGAILTQFAGDIDQVVFRKVLLGVADTRQTTVAGHPAIWAEGPQQFFIATADVEPYGLPRRLSSNSLLWAADGITYRLEVDLPLTRARQLAESIR